MSFVSANCPSCGGELQVPDDKEQVICMYCGNNVILQDNRGEEKKEISNLLKLANNSLDADKYDEAVNYYVKILEKDPENSEAWYGKAIALGNYSANNINNKSFSKKEIFVCLKNFNEFNDSDDKFYKLLKEVEEFTEKAIKNHKTFYSGEKVGKGVERETVIDSVITKSSDIIDEEINLIDFILDIHQIDFYSYHILTLGINKCKDALESTKWDGQIIGISHNKVEMNEHQYNDLSKKFKELSEKISDIDPNYQPPKVQVPQTRKTQSKNPTKYSGRIFGGAAICLTLSFYSSYQGKDEVSNVWLILFFALAALFFIFKFLNR